MTTILLVEDAYDLAKMIISELEAQGYHVLDDLFTLARSEVGKLELHYESIDVGQLVRKIVETGAPLAWQSSRIEMAADTPLKSVNVLVDPQRLEQILRNLIHNAVRHTTPGGIVAVEVKIESEAVNILVKDTGEGISPDDLPHIWERFYQTERSQTQIDGGAGLGLTLVKEWVEEMGGTVSVESAVGEGSCFTLHLPRSIECSEETNLKRQISSHPVTVFKFNDHNC